jgi:hypothetical protein
MYYAISQNKTAHMIKPNQDRTLCGVKCKKNRWTFLTKTENVKCEHCLNINKEEA